MEIATVESFLRYHANIRARTDRVVERIPHDRFDWTPRAGAFSFADLLRHLAAIERWMFAENVHGRPSRYPGHGVELADGPANVLAFYRRTRDDARDLFAALADAQLGEPCTTPGGATLPRWKWLRAMVEHEAHHRGQIYLMLNLLGIPTPPLYGLTSEEVRARSESAD